MLNPMKCPKCEGKMEEGFYVDTWHQGAVRKLNWANVLKKTLGLFSVVENKIEVIAYRCPSCGYLENYAK